MGIIISSFVGCGREYLKKAYGDRIKIFDAVENISIVDETNQTNQDLLDGYINKVMEVVDDNDIVFVGSSNAVREALNERNIDYDLFYPSKERRAEFIENQVIKRANPKNIQKLDRYFDEWVENIDNDDSENCFKHKLTNKGEFIANTPIIIDYIESLKND